MGLSKRHPPFSVERDFRDVFHSSQIEVDSPPVSKFLNVHRLFVSSGARVVFDALFLSRGPVLEGFELRSGGTAPRRIENHIPVSIDGGGDRETWKVRALRRRSHNRPAKENEEALARCEMQWQPRRST